MTLTVLKPGLLTTVQDQGRPGLQAQGIPVGGAVDAFAARVANALVGNDDGSAVLEMVLQGAQLRADQDTLVALCGAGLGLAVNGVEMLSDRPVRVRAGEIISGIARATGARACLAVAGGIDVPRVFGSRSTYVRGRMGGFEGRPLIAGDVVPVGKPSELSGALAKALDAGGERHPAWSVRPETLGRVAAKGGVRVVRAPEWKRFTPAAQAALFSGSYTVTKDVDRMGMRLQGPRLDLIAPREEISSGMNIGVVQVPPNGQPIVLLVGRQSVGGYPRIAAVVSVDHGRLAQLRPGDLLTFAEVTLADAHRLLQARERDFLRVKNEIIRRVA
ncbi:MAG TPA: biotin-dependent carboxyltransferase family protein [Candidatus Didemnitutus sp.]|nr:biotin-dependent carboxyltransferase family protein [Candidatus Didemnitutus sp.]